MAIKISNVTVIDDSRNLTNANTIVFASNASVQLPAGGTASRPVSVANGALRYNIDDAAFEGYAAGAWGPVGAGIPYIQTPTNTSPANGETGVPKDPTLAATNIRHVYNKDKASGTWQISVTPTFANTELDVTIAGSANSYTTTANLQYSSTYYWRVKYASADGNESEFSTPTQFTTQDQPPSVLGQSYQGGYYLGTIDIGGSTCYYLIVSPNATGCACCQWKTNTTATPDSSCLCDGYYNTYTGLNNGTHPAGNWTATRSINGYSDWYLPSRNEIYATRVNRSCLPGGEDFDNNYHWSSSQVPAPDTDRAYAVAISDGFTGNLSKTELRIIRAIRRVPF